MNTEPAQWREIRVYYHGDRDRLVRDGVRPLFDALDGAPTGYFVRHWQLGPHLRIPVRATPDAWRDVVAPAVAEYLGGFLRDHPSTARLDPDRLLAAHRRLADREEEPGPLLPWQPDNTLLVTDHHRRVGTLGSEAAVDLLEAFYAETNDAVFEMLGHARSDSRRRALAFDLLVATAHRMYPPVTLGFISFRSHAEAFLARQDPAGRLRAGFDDLYRQQATRLTGRVAAVVGCLGGAGTEVPFVTDWVSMLDRYRIRGAELAARGAALLDWDAAVPAGDDRPWVTRSPLHRMMRGSDNFVRFMNEHTPVRAYRLVLNFTYLHLARLGLTEIDRYLLCHLVANAVEARYGVSAMDRTAQVVEHGAPLAGTA